MAEPNEDFRGLMDRVRSGSEEAAREMFDRYSGHIARVVRRRLSQQMRSQYDSVDFLQAVWASFFALPANRFEFTRTEELLGFLSRMACNKVIDAVRRRGTQKEGAGREQPVAGGAPNPDEMPLHQPTPSQEVIAEERWQRLLEGEEAPKRQVLEMLRLGHSYGSISRATGLDPKTIQRFLRRLFEREDRL
jgi:RNA polymerase sigma-70 factor (ECF subfamily)